MESARGGCCPHCSHQRSCSVSDPGAPSRISALSHPTRVAMTSAAGAVGNKRVRLTIDVDVGPDEDVEVAARPGRFKSVPVVDTNELFLRMGSDVWRKAHVGSGEGMPTDASAVAEVGPGGRGVAGVDYKWEKWDFSSRAWVQVAP